MTPPEIGHPAILTDDPAVPHDVLCSTVRALLTASHSNAAIFTSAVRDHLTANPPQAPDPNTLLSSPSALDQLLLDARICFASHRLNPALYLLSLVADSIPQSQAKLKDRPINEQWKQLLQAGGDMLQAIQALKESGDRSDGVQSMLYRLVITLLRANDYCEDNNMPYPFFRALVQSIDAAKALFPSNSNFDDFTVPERHVMHHPKRDYAPLPTVQLNKNLKVPRLFSGLWQLSSPGWGTVSQDQCEDAISRLMSNGFSAFDMAGKLRRSIMSCVMSNDALRSLCGRRAARWRLQKPPDVPRTARSDYLRNKVLSIREGPGGSGD